MVCHCHLPLLAFLMAGSQIAWKNSLQQLQFCKMAGNSLKFNQRLKSTLFTLSWNKID
jgi:hypothetical protein